MFDCVRRENNLEIPKPKFLKVIIRLAINPLFDCCSSTEQQLSIFVFKSDKLFHIRPATNSTSTVDPHITPEDVYAKVPRISKVTGLPEYTLKTVLQFNIKKNKVTTVLVFAPNYVNVLEVNMELISGYPDVY